MKNFTEFNTQAEQYARFRPNYPEELFVYLKGLCDQTKVAYDVGTGSGQCAIGLAQYFEKVFASDFSEEQIAKALSQEKITYFVAPAHESGLLPNSVDIVTLATSIHWFDLALFYPEVKRVLKPSGIIAAWAYGFHECENPQITEIINEIGKGLLLPYWSEPPKLIWNAYQTLPFPFDELEPPPFEVLSRWNQAQLLGYLSTWSASQKFEAKHGHHPAQQFMDRLVKAWGDPAETLRFRSPLHLRVGRLNK